MEEARAVEHPKAQGRQVTFLALFATTVFLSAFLLFQVQPMIGKYILPWFGSTPGVWATALLFFQLMLLAGYAYAHFVLAPLSWRRQAAVHASLLVLALVSLPITPAEALVPQNSEAPVARILTILALSVGAPYFLLSATAPLLQLWFARLAPGRSPYRLYALSNGGSLLALFTYPFVVERLIPLRTQTSLWSIGYVVFAASCAACAWLLARRTGAEAKANATFGESGGGRSQGADAPRPGFAGADAPRPGFAGVGAWIALSACASGLLLATTNQITLDVPAAPFLWVVPLGVYLLTFMLCFDSDRWYVRPLFAALLPLALINSVRLLYVGIGLPMGVQVSGYVFTLFVCSMICHGELARLRPSPRYLTFYFLMIAVGGALGGALIAVGAPIMFTGLYEYPILLVVSSALAVSVVWPGLFRAGSGAERSRLHRVLSGVCWAAAAAVALWGSSIAVLLRTWLPEGAPRELELAFFGWRAGLLRTSPLVLIVFLVVLEVWRRVERESLAEWLGGPRSPLRLVSTALVVVGLWFLGGALRWHVIRFEQLAIARERNFYGTVVVRELFNDGPAHQLSMTHGRIRHGLQLVGRRMWPTTYFAPESGVGLAIRRHPARSDSTKQFRVGVVGLGAGTLAAYGNARFHRGEHDRQYVRAQPGGAPDYLRFYEINPLVERSAREQFSFIGDAISRGAEVDVVLGDGRIVLDRERAEGKAQRFDVLVLDAFSSDAIPIHLLTREAVEIYLEHLAEGGVLAFHVSNRYVDLRGVVASLADAYELYGVEVATGSDQLRQVTRARWLLLTRDGAFLDDEEVRAVAKPLGPPGPLWTDDRSSLWEVVRLGPGGRERSAS